MNFTEYSPLLLSSDSTEGQNLKGLSLIFAVICVIDIFGVFPIIALPGAVIKCGWFGLPLTIIIFLIQMYTAILLGKCWIIAEYLDKTIIAKNRYPYAALAEMTYGKTVSRIVTILLDITIFGGGIPNIIVAAQNLQLFGLKMSDNDFSISYCFWMLILGIILCPFLWLGSPKDMKLLCSLSVLVVFSTSILIWICIYNDNSQEVILSEFQTEESLFRNIITAYGILAFQFDIHPTLLTIQVDMKDKTKVSCIVFFGFLVTTILFTLTTIFAAIKYGLNTYPNILQGLPPSILLYLAVFLVTMQLCLTCAISNSALYQNIEDYLNIPREFNYKRCLMRSLLTALSIIVAESVPKFDLIMSLIGGTLIGPLVFIFPPLFYIKLIYLKRQHTRNLFLQTANRIMYHCETNFLNSNNCNDHFLNDFQNDKCFIESRWSYFETTKRDRFLYKMLIAVFVVIFGVFATITTTYISFINTINYASFSPPCFYNWTVFKNTTL